jgi:hypothetical protein
MAVRETLKIAGVTAVGAALPLVAAPYIDKDPNGNLILVPVVGPMLGPWGSYSAFGGVVGGAVCTAAAYFAGRSMSPDMQNGFYSLGVGLMTGGLLSGFKPAYPYVPPVAAAMRVTQGARVVQQPRMAQPAVRRTGNF